MYVCHPIRLIMQAHIKIHHNSLVIYWLYLEKNRQKTLQYKQVPYLEWMMEMGPPIWSESDHYFAGLEYNGNGVYLVQIVWLWLHDQSEVNWIEWLFIHILTVCERGGKELHGSVMLITKFTRVTPWMHAYVQRQLR